MGSRRRKATHNHKLKRVGPVWKCVLDCQYFVYFKQQYVILGNKIQCWNCTTDFTADERALDMELPFCYLCQNDPMRVTRRPDMEALDKISQVALKNQLSEVEVLAKYQYEILTDCDWDELSEEERGTWRNSAKRELAKRNTPAEPDIIEVSEPDITH